MLETKKITHSNFRHLRGNSMVRRKILYTTWQEGNLKSIADTITICMYKHIHVWLVKGHYILFEREPLLHNFLLGYVLAFLKEFKCIKHLCLHLVCYLAKMGIKNRKTIYKPLAHCHRVATSACQCCLQLLRHFPFSAIVARPTGGSTDRLRLARTQPT